VNIARTLNKGLLLAMAVMAASAMFASTAIGYPTKTVPCMGCHSGANVPVTATLGTIDATNASYSVSAPTATAIAVFSGSTKLFTFSATSAQFSVATGGTYKVIAVRGPGTGNGIGSTVISPSVEVPVFTDSTLSIRASAKKLKARKSVRLSGVLAPGGSGKVVSVYVQKPKSKAWKLVTTTSAESSGWATAYKLAKKGTYRFRATYAGGTTSGATTSGTVKVVAK